MDQNTQVAGSRQGLLSSRDLNKHARREGQQYSALQTKDTRDELANDAGHIELVDSPAPSYHLLDPDRETTKKGLGEPKFEPLTGSVDTSSYGQDRDGDGRSHLPPRSLTPLTNGQISLLVLELLAVLAMAISGLKGLSMLPELDIFSVPPMTQDCGGYSVPAVERSFYINLQVVRDLSFTRAKLLDLAWDTVVGQGGRFLHAWVLYQVAASQLAWMMEYSSVPYYFQLDILFSTASLPALWSTLRFLGTRRPARAVFSGVWFLLAILYVLAFSSIWGAATGYLNPSKPAYQMGDHSYTTIDSDGLNLCMPMDTQRLNDTVPALVQGPQLGRCFKSFDDIGDWTYCNITEGSDEWTNVLSYYKTKDTIQSFYYDANSTGIVNETTDFNDWGYGANEPYDLGGVSINRGIHRGQYGYTGDSMSDSSGSGISVSGYSHRYSTAVKGLYRQFTGFQFAGAGQEVANTSTPWFNVTFQVDPSVNISNDDWLTYTELDPVPYNSTLWWNGSGIALDAPFLDIPARKNDCEWFPGRDMCVCYRDELLTTDFRRDDNLICISEEGYVWGFSSVITLIGVILEVCWIVGCFGMWLDVHINSNMFRMNRRGSGAVRNILDIGGAIQNDLGHDTGAYQNGALKKELEKLPPVGYEVVDGEQHSRITVVSMPGARRRGGGLKPGKLYA
ncbi:hypothetical protein diail_2855 [Diaporthe ilicicola]|nr:hypothetical protein diail_2855 [Diaporthe ilicicola]